MTEVLVQSGAAKVFVSTDTVMDHTKTPVFHYNATHNTLISAGDGKVVARFTNINPQEWTVVVDPKTFPKFGLFKTITIARLSGVVVLLVDQRPLNVVWQGNVLIKGDEAYGFWSPHDAPLSLVQILMACMQLYIELRTEKKTLSSSPSAHRLIEECLIA